MNYLILIGIVIWTFIGFWWSLMILAKIGNYITVSDVIICLMVSVLGPIVPIATVLLDYLANGSFPGDKVLWRKK